MYPVLSPIFILHIFYLLLQNCQLLEYYAKLTISSSCLQYTHEYTNTLMHLQKDNSLTNSIWCCVLAPPNHVTHQTVKL